MPWLKIAQIVISLLLIISILMQNRGTGLGSAFGGGNSVYLTKRGVEKKLFYATIVLAILFFLSSFAGLIF
ncbi:MAG: preprotein translocase subunit SecG [Candidatus Falkowbacteria bacterium]|nr:preprotein translocase subunit SecG [Candidatus Falkowbacteria bacterium]